MLRATWKRKRRNLINDDNPHPGSIAGSPVAQIDVRDCSHLLL